MCKPLVEMGMVPKALRGADSPFLRRLPDRQIDYLHCRVIRGKQLALVDGLADHAVQGLNGVGGVDGPADVLRVLEQRIYVMPVAAPDPTDGRVFLVPAVGTAIRPPAQ
jgi:hypothetical protein